MFQLRFCPIFLSIKIGGFTSEMGLLSGMGYNTNFFAKNGVFSKWCLHKKSQK
jgi:hypothetical protein